MSALGKELAGKGRRIVVMQLLVAAVVAVAFFVIATAGGQGAGLHDAFSAFYGGLSSVVLALISIRGFKRANALALTDPKQSMMILYIGAVLRFAAVIVLLGIGLGLLEFDPTAVFVGFALAQASYLIGARDRKAARGQD